MTGNDNRSNQLDARRNGRLAFEAYQAAQLDLMQRRQDRANARRMARLRPHVIRPLVVAEDPNTGERRVLSELRREYPWHPLGEVMHPTAMQTGASWLSRLWGKLVAGVVAVRVLSRKLRPVDDGRF